MRDDWKDRQIQNLASENRLLREHLLRAKAQIAQLELQQALGDNRDRTDVAWLNGKVLRQKRRIKALEERRELSQIESVEAAQQRLAEREEEQT